jgi:outer membrane receptor protein involved in Fe transport
VPPFFPPRQHLPSYAILDLHMGLQTDKYSLTCYAQNLGNTSKPLGLVSENYLIGTFGPQDATFTRPRTVGFTLAAKF